MEALMHDLLSNVDWAEIGIASWDTLIMVAMSLLFSVVIGLPVGVLLFCLASASCWNSPWPTRYCRS